jgi:hypothetical protein
MEVKVMGIRVNDRVVVISDCNSKGEFGTVDKFCNYSGNTSGYVVVNLDNGETKSYNVKSLKLIDINKEDIKMEVGEYKIAIVNLIDDYYKKDYGFYLFDKAKVGDTVVVNPNNKFTIGTIKSIKTPSEYGKNVTKDVIAVVDMNTYKKRVEDRKQAIELAKKKKEIQKELDNRISKLKTLDFYETMAKQLGDKDPELVSLLSQYKEIVG